MSPPKFDLKSTQDFPALTSFSAPSEGRPLIIGSPEVKAIPDPRTSPETASRSGSDDTPLVQFSIGNATGGASPTPASSRLSESPRSPGRLDVCAAEFYPPVAPPSFLSFEVAKSIATASVPIIPAKKSQLEEMLSNAEIQIMLSTAQQLIDVIQHTIIPGTDIHYNACVHGGFPLNYFLRSENALETTDLPHDIDLYTDMPIEYVAALCDSIFAETGVISPLARLLAHKKNKYAPVAIDEMYLYKNGKLDISSIPNSFSADGKPHVFCEQVNYQQVSLLLKDGTWEIHSPFPNLDNKEQEIIFPTRQDFRSVLKGDPSNILNIIRSSIVYKRKIGSSLEKAIIDSIEHLTIEDPQTQTALAKFFRYDENSDIGFKEALKPKMGILNKYKILEHLVTQKEMNRLGIDSLNLITAIIAQIGDDARQNQNPQNFANAVYYYVKYSPTITAYLVNPKTPNSIPSEIYYKDLWLFQLIEKELRKQLALAKTAPASCMASSSMHSMYGVGAPRDCTDVGAQRAAPFVKHRALF